MNESQAFLFKFGFDVSNFRLFFLSSQKNSVPEAMIPGLYVVKEDNKIILQVPNSGQSAVCADQQLKSPC